LFCALNKARGKYSAMDVWADELAKALKSECEVLNELYKTSENKTDIIIKGDVAQLDGIINYEQSLLMQLVNIEQTRQKILKQEKIESLTLSEIAEKSGNSEKDMFLNCLSSFKNIAAELKRSNDLNNKLVRSRLNMYEQLQGVRNSNTYASGGKVRKLPAKRSLMDKMV
jgi:flagellar biosynthesis/type III secretory pathway chaperone